MCEDILNHPDILLLVAENAELSAVAALMRTNKSIWQIISSYERSIAATRLQKIHFPPDGDVMSTRDPLHREVFPRLSLNTVCEFERRERRISSLVKGQFLGANNAIPYGKRTQYLAQLERATHLCDCIYDLGSGDVAASESRREVREAQVNFIKRLSISDLAFLGELAWMGSIGWARSKGAVLESDPDTWYKSLAFEELVLRQGSLFLWGYAMGPSKYRQSAEKYILQGASEIREWETGLGLQLPSLRQTVIRTFTAKKGCGFKNAFSEMAITVAQRSGEGS